jgi:murein DD-endopeptidase MepM/ murein hydrolase activator NlpD
MKIEPVLVLLLLAKLQIPTALGQRIRTIGMTGGNSLNSRSINVSKAGTNTCGLIRNREVTESLGLQQKHGFPERPNTQSPEKSSPDHLAAEPVEKGIIDGITPVERNSLKEKLARYYALYGPAGNRQPAQPARYSFHPQAGTLWKDLFINNFYDFDPGSSILDWDCSDWTYNGHQGDDTDICGFAEQEIGVPIFAALDGTVVATHDGEFDRQTQNQPAAIANYVVLDHGGTHLTYYWHLKKGSVSVSVGQFVSAGTQIGLTGSSGASDSPHLHFISEFNSIPYEPYTGACNNPGESYWLNQPPIRRELYLRDFKITGTAYSDVYAWPNEMPTQGTFIRGTRLIGFRVLIANLPAASTFRIVYRRPDGTVQLDSGNQSLGNPYYRKSWWWYQYYVDLDMEGTWHLDFSVNGTTILEAPFKAVAMASQILNYPPAAVPAVPDPASPKAGNVIFCRLDAKPLQDPDYDVVRFRFEWKVNGVSVRTVTSAALSDALAGEKTHAGDQVECRITPNDGMIDGPSAVFTVNVRHAAWDSADFNSDGSTDVAAFHLSSDQFFTNYAGNIGQYGWGGNDCYPLIWDFNSNGATDVSIYHIPTNQWFVRGVSGDNLGAFGWGVDEAVPVPGDYNGDGTVDRAFFHWPTNRWFVEQAGGSFTDYAFGWGGADCIPIAADYDGDGTTDMMLYHVPTNQWFVHGAGNLGQFGWNGSECIPVPGDWDGDGRTEIGIYHWPSNQWFWRNEDGTTHSLGQYGWGGTQSFPIPGDYNGDGVMERAFYRPAENWWFIEEESDFVWGYGGSDFMPITSQMAIYNWFRFGLGKFQ